MLNFLHSFHHQAILFSLGNIHIYWYGLFIVLAILAAMFVAFSLAKPYSLKNDLIFDLAFWLIILGIIGARLYDVVLELPYYLHYPSQIIKIWQGGLSIHGAILAGLIFIIFFSRYHKISGWKLTAIIAPGLALGQAIGRWGNYFNQELFGLPTDGRWGIPIDIVNRPLDYLNYQYFQPTFIYESLGCLIIFLLLFFLNKYYIAKNKLSAYFFVWMTALYMILYSILRFSLEFIKINPTPSLFNLRWPQIISLLLIFKSSIIQK